MQQIKHKVISLVDNWERIFNSLADFISIHDTNFRFVKVNRAFADYMGMKPEEIEGRFCYEIVHGTDEPPPECPHLQFAEYKEGKTYEVVEPRLGGEVHITVSPIFGDKGEFLGSFHLIRNIEAEIKLRRQLSHSEKYLRSIIDNEPGCVKLIDRDGRLLEMNAAGLRMIEAESLQQVVGQQVYGLVAPEHRDAFQKLTEDVCDGTPGSLEFQMIGLRGGRLWLEIHAVPFLDEVKGETYFLAVTRDITAYRQAQDKLVMSEKWLRESQEVAKIGSWSLNLVNNTLEWSAETFRRFDKDPATFTPSRDYFIGHIHPDDREDIRKAMEDILAHDAPYHVQPRIRNDNGREWVMEAYGRVERDAEGRPVRFAGTAQDITERQRAEDGLQKQKDFLQNALDALTHPFYIIDVKDYTIKLANKAARFGELREGTTCYKLTHHRNKPCKDDDHPCTLDLVKKTKKPVVVEHRHYGRTGLKSIYEVHAYPIFDESGNIVQMIEYSIDITEKKKKKQEIAFLASIITNIPDTVCAMDLEGNIISWNKGAETMFGYVAAEIIGEHISITIPEELVEQELDYCLKTLNEKGFLSGHESVRLTKDKKIVPVEITALALRDEEQQITSYTSILRNISERKRAEEELQKWSQVFEHAEWGVAVSSGGSQRMEMINPAFTRMHGYTVKELVGKPILDVFAPKAQTELVQQLQLARQKGHCSFESNHVRKDGTVFPVLNDVTTVKDNAGGVRFQVINVQDLTLRKQLESQLRQTQKMEAVGTLAGGIAHDFNNILAAMIGFTELARYDIPAGNAASSALDEVLQAGMRAKELVGQILAFSHQTEKKLTPFKIQYVLKEALQLLRASIPTTIEFRKKIDPACGPVLADPTQIHQVIMNLCTNAYHAMRKSTGTLGVSLSAVEVGPGGRIKDLALRPGSYVMLEISDTGCGIEPAIQDRIFEPYFTTKEKGEGTGLGLSVVHGIVKSFDGYIRVASEPGAGTTVQIYLPLLTGDEMDLQESIAEDPVAGGGERILVVDDEESILRFEQQVLTKMGYVVTVIDSSVAALQLFQEQPEDFDLIITDMTMPKMTGAELARKILAIRPDIPIILCTGYSSLISEQEAKRIGIRKFFVKPLQMQQLTQGARSVLDSYKQ